MKVKYLGGGWVKDNYKNQSTIFRLTPGKVYEASIDPSHQHEVVYRMVGDCGKTIFIEANDRTTKEPSFEVMEDTDKRIEELENVLKETQSYLRGLCGKVDYETWCDTYEPLRKISSVLSKKD